MSNKRGGKGAVASTAESIYLDTLLKETSQEISKGNPHYTFSSKVRFDQEYYILITIEIKVL